MATRPGPTTPWRPTASGPPVMVGNALPGAPTRPTSGCLCSSAIRLTDMPTRFTLSPERGLPWAVVSLGALANEPIFAGHAPECGQSLPEINPKQRQISPHQALVHHHPVEPTQVVEGLDGLGWVAARDGLSWGGWSKFLAQRFRCTCPPSSSLPCS